MLATRIAITALALVCATAAAAQTHAELLEKAIFTDETAGDLPGAIRLYERLLNTPGLSREMAARAQTRLADGKRRRDQAVVSLAAVHTSSAVESAGPTSASIRQTAVFAPRADAPRAAFQTGTQAPGCCGMFSGTLRSSQVGHHAGQSRSGHVGEPGDIHRHRRLRRQPVGVYDRRAERAAAPGLQQGDLQAR